MLSSLMMALSFANLPQSASETPSWCRWPALLSSCSLGGPTYSASHNQIYLMCLPGLQFSNNPQAMLKFSQVIWPSSIQLIAAFRQWYASEPQLAVSWASAHRKWGATGAASPAQLLMCISIFAYVFWILVESGYYSLCACRIAIRFYPFRTNISHDHSLT